MSSAEFERADEILRQALELAPERRLAFVETATPGDPALRARVVELLAHANAEDLPTAGALAGNTWRQIASRLDRAAPGDRVGRFLLLEELGRGGMAVVYRARRVDDVFEQEVALKILRPSPLSGAYEERFAQERQILARLNHPNIAKIHDGGATNEGHPYFAMELVQGRPIDEHCRVHRLDLRARVGLLLQIVDALEAAHRLLIVHRDLKPSNVLVTEEGHVKLLDFGIAKVLESSEMETQHTGDARFLTPQFASPEQLLGEPVTTATDIYQLAGLMYLLFCGETPHQLEGLSFREVRRVMCDTDPVAPSVAFARRRAENAHELGIASSSKWLHQLRGDLDAICLVALRREPRERYRSLALLREDLERHLAGAPLRARSSERIYRWWRFVLRHRVFAAAALLLVLYAFTATTLGLRMRQKEAEAREAAERSTAVVDFLQALLSTADPQQAGEGGLRARDLLLRAPQQMDRAVREDPELEATIRLLSGEVLYRLGDHEEAVQQVRPLLAASFEEPGTPQLAYLRARARLLLLEQQEMADRQNEVLDGLAQLAPQVASLPPSPQRTELLGRLLLLRSQTLQTSGRRAQALEVAQDALERFTELASITQQSTAAQRLLLRASAHYADVLRLSGEQPDRAIELLEESLEQHAAFYGTHHPALIAQLRSLAGALGSRAYRTRETDAPQSSRDLEHVDQLVDRAIALSREHYGERHLDVVAFWELKGATAHTRKQWAEAYRAYRSAREVLAALPGHGARAARNLSAMGRALMNGGDLERAGDLLRRAREESVREAGPGHIQVAEVDWNLADHSYSIAQWDRAVEYAERALGVYSQLGGRGAERVQGVQLILADALLARAASAETRRELARADLERAESLFEQLQLPAEDLRARQEQVASLRSAPR